MFEFSLMQNSLVLSYFAIFGFFFQGRLGLCTNLGFL